MNDFLFITERYSCVHKGQVVRGFASEHVLDSVLNTRSGMYKVQIVVHTAKLPKLIFFLQLLRRSKKQF